MFTPAKDILDMKPQNIFVSKIPELDVTQANRPNSIVEALQRIERNNAGTKIVAFVKRNYVQTKIGELVKRNYAGTKIGAVVKRKPTELDFTGIQTL